MAERYSFVGPKLARIAGSGIVRRLDSRRGELTLVLVVVVAVMLAIVTIMGAADNTLRPARSSTVNVIPGVPLVYQYYDTAMFCLPCQVGGFPQGPHPWNDAKGPDGIYGTIDDCPHCSAYCAPASIAMISSYRGLPPPMILEDFIYDAGKSANGEITGNGAIETHGFGMFQGTGGWPFEVQMAMTWSLGQPIQQYDWNPLNVMGPMTPVLLQSYIVGWTPVLWLDVGGFPANQSPSAPPPPYRLDLGHAKVIIGYDDRGTQGNTSDDLCLINDPWPEYNDLGVLPVNCTQGPGGTRDPYWQPLNDINLKDQADIYLVDTFPLIPEFTNPLVPVIGIAALVAVFAVRRKSSV